VYCPLAPGKKVAAAQVVHREERGERHADHQIGANSAVDVLRDNCPDGQQAMHDHHDGEQQTRPPPPCPVR